MEEGEGEMNWENSVETRTLPYVKQMTSLSLMHEAGHPKPVLWDNLEGWGVVQDGGDTCMPVTDSYWCMASQVAQGVKNLPAMQEMPEIQAWSLGWEDPVEEGTAAHSNILAWKIPWTEEPGGLQSMGSQRVGHNWSDWAHGKNITIL